MPHGCCVGGDIVIFQNFLESKFEKFTFFELWYQEQSDGGGSESTKTLAADIHAMIAQLAALGNDIDNAIKFYAKAATFLPNTVKARVRKQ